MSLSVLSMSGFCNYVLPQCLGLFPSDSAVKDLPAMQETQETQVPSLGWEDLREEEMATHSSILAWKIPRTEEPGGLQFIRLHELDKT